MLDVHKHACIIQKLSADMSTYLGIHGIMHKLQVNIFTFSALLKCLGSFLCLAYYCLVLLEKVTRKLESYTRE